MFIENDEHIIIMDCEAAPLRRSEFQSLEECGIKTVWLHGGVDLNIYWDNIYRRVEDLLEYTKLKMLLPFFCSPSQGDWFKNGAIDYANPDVAKSMDDTTLKLLEYFAPVRDRVQLTYAHSGNGEYPWPLKSGPQTTKGPVSKEELARFIADRQKILSSQHNEVWLPMAHILGHFGIIVDEINRVLHLEFADCAHYRIQYTHFPLMSESVRWIIKSNPQSKYFVGSEYVEGLVSNYEEGILQGVWGFLTSPTHRLSSQTRVEPGMLKIIRNVNEALCNEYHWDVAIEHSNRVLEELK